MDVIYLANDHVIELQGLTNGLDGSTVESATVTCTLTDDAGQPIAGQAWPLALTHTGQGTYQATLDAALQLTNRQTVVAVITATAGSLDAEWRMRLKAIPRR